MPALIGQSSNIKSSLALILAVLAIFVAITMRSTPCAYAASGSCSVGDLEVFTSAITVNEDGNDADTRFEGDTNQNLWYLDAGNDRIGLGTSAPSAFFDVRGISSFGDNNITNVADIAVDSISADGASLAISDDAFWADSKGLVVGHTAKIAGPSTAELQVLGTAAADSSILLGRFVIGPNGAHLYFLKSDNASVGGNTAVDANDTLGEVNWVAADGDDFTSLAATISAFAEQDALDGDTPGRLVYSTTADAAASPTERMRNPSDGGLAFPELAGDPATLANFAHIYSKNGTHGAEIFVQDEAANVTEISPHEGDNWFFNSCNRFTGKCVSIDMEAALNALEALTGQELITTTFVPPDLIWEDEQLRLFQITTDAAEAWDATPVENREGQSPIIHVIESRPQWLTDRLAESNE